MKTKLEFIFENSPPWLYFGAGETERNNWIPSYFYSKDDLNTCVRSLRGRKMQTTRSLMDEISAALQFFSGFGENWHALEDCLECMPEWLPTSAYILIIEEAELVLISESDHEKWALLKTFDIAGNSLAVPITNNGHFDREPMPLHVLMHFSKPESSPMRKFMELCDKHGIKYRV